MSIAFSPACHASQEAVYKGNAPISGNVSWQNSYCNVTTTFDPGNPAAGQFYYFVVVGQNGVLEGSYGQNSSGVERPESVGIGACEMAQGLGSCP